jgi:pimeloyl-ACP methyl ester carboxylesterase
MNYFKCCKAKERSTNLLQVNGISLHVENQGSGKPVLLLHGWPDSSHQWRNQETIASFAEEFTFKDHCFTEWIEY